MGLYYFALGYDGEPIFFSHLKAADERKARLKARRIQVSRNWPELFMGEQLGEASPDRRRLKRYGRRPLSTLHPTPAPTPGGTHD